MSTFPPQYGPGMEPTRTFVLLGECHQCGLCCVEERDGEVYRCMALVQIGALGEPGTTVCRDYDERYDRMPIVLRAPSGKRLAGLCLKGSPEETANIIAKGISTGKCSYEVVG